MSTSASPAVIPPANSTQMVALQKSFEQLDAFAKDNSLESIVGEAGAFTAQLRLAGAMVQLREMLTPEVMKPIMALQGSSLGFRTDKDSTGGYPESVVKEVLIEATIKGFRLLGNETNVIAGRFYAARDGFERIFRDLSKRGHLTDLRLLPSVPKTAADGAIVDYVASWTFKGIKDELKLSIPIRVNAGQGPDAVLGKAKRKMLAAIYSRITGTEITDGDVDDPTSINVTATAVKEQAKADPITPETLAAVEKLLTPHELPANAYLIQIGTIVKGQTFRDVTEKFAKTLLTKRDGFFNAAGIAKE
jgi:hypothetical protein